MLRFVSFLWLCLLLPALFAQDIPRPEHPEPQFVREQWLNLNGNWNFAIDHGLSGEAQGWHEDPAALDQTILVPFAPESKLSGIEHLDFMPAVWYHRSIEIPADWDGQRVFLNFGAVDYDCQAWVNGQPVGRHYGGSVSFSFEITEALQPGENQLVVEARDDIRSEVQPAGKQSSTFANDGCCKYTRTTGIWQTVWLEARPQTHLASVHIVPDFDNGRFFFTPELNGNSSGHTLRIRILAEGREITQTNGPVQTGIPTMTALPFVRAWSPEDPFLYDLAFELLKNGEVVDQVESYAGLRKVHIEGHKIMLNNKPVFQRLVLDQGFWPEGIWTAPSDAELKADIERSMAVGFNGARLHEKIFEPRFHYWADRLGYLTWGEYPDWGVSRTYNEPEAWLNTLREWREAMMRDRNHPSIIAWTPMNETHSAKQGFEAYRRAAEEVYELTRDLDPTRPVNEASGFLHIKTDLFTVHDYDQDPERFRERYLKVHPDSTDVYHLSWDWYGKVPEYTTEYEGQPYVVDEYGGTFWLPEYANEAPRGNGRSNWGYGKSEAEVLKLITDLTLALTDNPYIAGYTYTQLTDVQQEVNGIYTFDRKLKFDAEKLKAAFGAAAAIEEE